MKYIKFLTLLLITFTSSNSFGYTLFFHNNRKDQITVTVTPVLGSVQTKRIKEGGEATIDTGINCIRKIKVFGQDGSSIEQNIEGLCFIPGITGKSKSYNVFIGYSEYMTAAGTTATTKQPSGTVPNIIGGQVIPVGITMELQPIWNL